MPIVELLVIIAFEARAPQPEHLQVVAEHRPDHRRRHMSGVGDALGGVNSRRMAAVRFSVRMIRPS